jgi:hypothetical protein
MFRFTIRELVLVTLAIAMGVGWGVDRARLASQLAEAQKSADTAWHALSHPAP